MKNYPIPLQPMGFSSFIENTFRIFGKTWKKTVPITLLTIGIAMAVLYSMIFLQMMPMMKNMMSLAASSTGALDSNQTVLDFYMNWFRDSGLWYFIGLLIVSLVTGFLISPFLASFTSRIASQYFNAEDLSVRETAHASARDIGRLILTMLAGSVVFLVLYAILAGSVVLLTLGTIYLTPILGVLLILMVLAVILVFTAAIYILQFSMQITIFEGTCGFNALIRATKMIFRRFWFSIGVNIVIGLIISTVAGTVSSVFILALFGPSAFVIVGSMIIAAVYAASMPILYIASTLLYYDLKIEHENYYTEQMMAANAPAAE
jgi:hypothetical protein